MKAYFLPLLLLFSMSVFGDDQEIQLPDQFTMKQTIFAWGTDFMLRDLHDGHSLGKVSQKLLNWTKTFEMQNASGETVSKAKEKFFTWGATADIYDQSGKKIATIKEQVFNSLFKVSTTYSILDESGREIATSEKFEFFSTDFTLKDKAGNVVATMHRPAINLLADTWTVTVNKPGVIDPRIIPFVPAFKTAVDSERRSSSSDNSIVNQKSLDPNKLDDQFASLSPAQNKRSGKEADFYEKVIPVSHLIMSRSDEKVGCQSCTAVNGI